MGTVRLVITGTILWYILFPLAAYGGGTGSAISGALGPLYFMWFIFVGNAVGLGFGFLYLVGTEGKAEQLFPETDDEFEKWALTLAVFMWGIAMVVAFVAMSEISGSFPGIAVPDGFFDKHFNGGGTFGKAAMFGTLFPGGLAFLFLFVTSPYWLYKSVVGIGKLATLAATKPALYDSAKAMAVGKDVPFEKVVGQVPPPLPTALRPPAWVYIPGAQFIYNYIQGTKSYWTNQTNQQFKDATASAKAAREALIEREKSKGLDDD
ncbi:MAG: hypothetical protein AB7U75_17245 [Hyphomicrobiaceae bacterium]